MIYRIDFTKEADSDIAHLKRSEPEAYKKVLKLLEDDRKEQWSRRITRKHRLAYKIEESKITVIVIAAYGHYGDK